jgi:hypothetical protein
MTTKLQRLLAAGLIAWSASASADILELKNGTILNGKYVGGTAGTVRFETGAGMQVLGTAEVVALTFGGAGGATTPAAPGAPAPAVAAPAAPASVTLPAGTMLLIRLLDPISSKNAPGASFSTKLEYDLVVGNTVAVKAGTTIYGKVQSSSQAGRATGRSTLDIRLVQMAPAGRPVTIVTSGYQQAGEASIKKAARGAAAGAAIGAIADGGEGAGKGAAIGATAGALRRGQTVTITPGTLLEFNLTQPVTIQLGT